MSKISHQLELFSSQSINPTYEIKRQIRLVLSECNMSRDEIVDRMNKIAVQEGMRKTISKATLDSWTKDSEPDRLPSLPWLTIFCQAAETIAPIEAMIRPLGCGVLDNDDQRLLAWAKAEMEKRKAVKRARLALEGLDHGI